MLRERRIAILEDISEAESKAELAAIWDNWLRDAPEVMDDAEVLAAFAKQMSMDIPLSVVGEDWAPSTEPIGLLPEHASPAQPSRVVTQAARSRTPRKYQLLKTDVSWSSKPQVHSLMDILRAHLNVGDVVSEEDIVRMVEANESVLQTRQGGKRIWDYYKGDHVEGLQAHGNVQKVG